MVALQILKIWIYLTVSSSLPGEELPSKVGGGELALIFQCIVWNITEVSAVFCWHISVCNCFSEGITMLCFFICLTSCNQVLHFRFPRKVVAEMSEACLYKVFSSGWIPFNSVGISYEYFFISFLLHYYKLGKYVAGITASMGTMSCILYSDFLKWSISFKISKV